MKNRRAASSTSPRQPYQGHKSPQIAEDRLRGPQREGRKREGQVPGRNRGEHAAANQEQVRVVPRPLLGIDHGLGGGGPDAVRADGVPRTIEAEVVRGATGGGRLLDQEAEAELTREHDVQPAGQPIAEERPTACIGLADIRADDVIERLGCRVADQELPALVADLDTETACTRRRDA